MKTKIILCRLLLYVIFSFTPLFIFADGINVNGIHYRFRDEGEAFVTCTGEYKSFFLVGELFAEYQSDYSGVINIPLKVKYNGIIYPVTSIFRGAFYQCTQLSSVTIPSSVTSIGENAFNGCTGLTRLVIQEGVKSIHSLAFRDCTSLKSITIPKSIQKIGSEAFKGCCFTDIYCVNQTPADVITEVESLESLFEFDKYSAFDGFDKSTCKLHVPKGCKAKYVEMWDWPVEMVLEDR